jgi:FlaG/FlaF family flagellin (archaellin)
VVGVAILIGIAVILASVVGSFAFGLVDIGAAPPDGQFTFENELSSFSAADAGTTDDSMNVLRTTLNSGETLRQEEIVVKVSGNHSEPQSNASVFSVNYQGSTSDDEWAYVWNASMADTQYIEPGDSARLMYYGVDDRHIMGQLVQDYNVVSGSTAGSDRTVAGPLVGIGGEDSAGSPYGHKLTSCDQVKVVWRSSSGERGEVFRSYQIPGPACS